jgi:osmoprotectant transport system substrate-binding protein
MFGGRIRGASEPPSRKRSVPRLAIAIVIVLAAAIALAACGQSFAPSTTPVSIPKGQPGKGKPPVVIGDKNFTEEFILGQLYAQALRAKGFMVTLRPDLGPTSTTDEDLVRGRIDMYPEYTGVIVSTLQDINLAAPGAPAPAKTPPTSAKQAYEQAAEYENGRGFKMLDPSPFQDADRVAVLPSLASKYGLKTMSDLKKLGTFTYGGPPENRTRYEGVRGMQQAYGLHLTFVPYAIGKQYAALNAGRVQTIAVFTTDGQLLHGHYVVLSDPKNIFGFQQVAPVVRKSTLKQQGPAFEQTLNAVTQTLTTPVIQRLNYEVAVAHQPAAAVAKRFLAQHVLR